MSESLVVACDLEETVAEVLTQLVQDGGEMPVELLQEQVELHLEYSEGSLSKWQNFLGSRFREIFKSENPVSQRTRRRYSAPLAPRLLRLLCRTPLCA